MTIEACAFVSLIIATGVCVLAYGALHWSGQEPIKFLCYLLVALFASRLKVNLPGITGTMSIDFLFILLGLRELSLAETLVLECFAFLNAVRPPRPAAVVQVAFNIGASALAIAAAYWMYHLTLLHKVGNTPLPLVAAGSICFVATRCPWLG